MPSNSQLPHSQYSQAPGCIIIFKLVDIKEHRLDHEQFFFDIHDLKVVYITSVGQILKKNVSLLDIMNLFLQ